MVSPCAFRCLSPWNAEGPCVDRGFKALKQSTKILYLTLHRPEEALETYRELLGYVKVRTTPLSSSPNTDDGMIDRGDEERLGEINQQYPRLRRW